MYKAASQKIGIFLTGFILLAWAAIVPPSLSIAGMHELSDREMAAVYARGFSSFSLTTDAYGNSLATMTFPNITIGTYTQINQMAMGYYPINGTTAWDNNWTSVSLGTPSTDLIAQGLYIEAGFSGDMTNPATRQLQYIRIGTTSLKGDVSANFQSFSGTIGGTTYNRTNFGAKTITSTGDINSGFNLSLAGSGSQMGFSFNFGSSSTIH